MGGEGEEDVSDQKRRRRAQRWVWAAIDPVSKLLLAVVVGDRSLATAQILVHLTIQALAPGMVPLFLSDQLAHYATASLTHFIERVNRTLRHHIPALGRRVESLAKTEVGLRRQALLVQGYYNFCLPHSSLRVLLPEPIPTKGAGSPKKWQQRTPAMAAGIADHFRAHPGSCRPRCSIRLPRD